MGGRLDALGWQRLYPRCVFQDLTALRTVPGKLLVTEPEAREPGHVGDIDLNGHDRRVYRLVTSSQPGREQKTPSGRDADSIVPVSTKAQRTGGNLERNMLGAVALIMIGSGAAGMLTVDDPGWPGIVLRSGIILGAIWVALPSLRRLQRRTWIAIGIPALVLMFRPWLILWGALAGAIVWVFSRRNR